MITTRLRLACALAWRDRRRTATGRFLLGGEALLACVYFFAIYYVGRLIRPESVGGDYFTLTLIGVSGYLFASGLTMAPRQFLIQEIGGGHLETLMTLGPSLGACVDAAAFSQAGRLLLRSAVVLLVAAVAGQGLMAARLLPLLPLLLLSGIAALGLGRLQAALLLSSLRQRRWFTLANAAGSILSGVYFPVSLLPSGLKHLAALFPATHAIAAARDLLVSGVSPLPACCALALLAVIYWALALWLWPRAERALRRDGAFSAY